MPSVSADGLLLPATPVFAIQLLYTMQCSQTLGNIPRFRDLIVVQGLGKDFLKWQYLGNCPKGIRDILHMHLLENYVKLRAVKIVIVLSVVVLLTA